MYRIQGQFSIEEDAGLGGKKWDWKGFARRLALWQLAQLVTTVASTLVAVVQADFGSLYEKVNAKGFTEAKIWGAAGRPKQALGLDADN